MNRNIGLYLLAGAAFTSAAVAAEPVSRDEVRAIVSEMMADAETRSSLLQGAGTAGYDKNFFVASADNNFKLNVSGFIQFRYYINASDDDNTGSTIAEDDFNGGFHIRKAVVLFSGHVINPDLRFNVRINSNNHESLNYDDVNFAYNLGDGWGIRGGQYKIGFLKEELNSDTTTLAAERGIVNAVFTQSRSQGVGVTYRTDEWDFTVDFTDGLRSLNTDWTGTGITTPEADYAITGRADWRFRGTRDQLRDYTSRQDEGYAGQVGGAVHWQQSSNTPVFAGEFDRNILGYTVDAQVEGSGLSLFAAFVGMYNSVDSAGVDETDNNDFGVVVQGGWRFMPNTEVFARYDGIFLDEERDELATGGFTNVQENYNFLTFGVNHYFAGQAAKLTVDCVMSFNPTASDGAGDGTTLRLDSAATGVVANSAILNSSFAESTGIAGTNEGFEAAIRAQFQLLF